MYENVQMPHPMSFFKAPKNSGSALHSILTQMDKERHRTGIFHIAYIEKYKIEKRVKQSLLMYKNVHVRTRQ